MMSSEAYNLRSRHPFSSQRRRLSRQQMRPGARSKQWFMHQHQQ